MPESAMVFLLASGLRLPSFTTEIAIVLRLRLHGGAISRKRR